MFDEIVGSPQHNVICRKGGSEAEQVSARRVCLQDTIPGTCISWIVLTYLRLDKHQINEQHHKIMLDIFVGKSFASWTLRQAYAFA